MRQLETFCGFPFRKIKVRANGDVNMCCYQRGSLGNLFLHNFTDIWHGPLAQEVRAKTLVMDLHQMCVGWGGCAFLVKPRVPVTIPVDSDLPTELLLDLPNTHCNVGGTSPRPETACFMCPRAASGFKPERDRTAELVERLKPLMPHLTRLQILGVAEPFWKDRVFEVLEGLGFQQHNEKCIFNTYTSGSVFSEERQKRFLKLCPRAALYFSLDAATPETYRRIRRLNAFHLVLDNIRQLIRQRGPQLRVEISNNLNLINLSEAAQMVELGKELGVDRIQFNPTHEGGGRRADLDAVLVNRFNYRSFSDAQEIILRRASEIGMDINIVRPLDMGFSAKSLEIVSIVNAAHA